jgi:hypothetical protein
MKSFVLSSLFACGLAAPTTHVNSGVPVGPLTPAFGDAVQTPKGLRSLALEGFSEDLNQDGFVDPIGQAVVAAPVAYTVPHLVSAANVGVAPVAAVRTAVAPIAYNIPNVYATAPVAVKAAEPVEVKAAPVTYTVPQVYTHSVPQVYTHAVPQVYTHAVSSVGVPASTELLTKTVVAAPAIQYVSAPYAPLTPFVGGIPVAAPAAPAAPAAEEAAGVEVA